MTIETIPLTVPNKFKETHRKLGNVFPCSMIRSPFIPVTKKRFPKDFIQLWLAPFKDPKYQYLVCVKPVARIPIPFAKLHDCNCLVQFTREQDDVKAMLYVQLN